MSESVDVSSVARAIDQAGSNISTIVVTSDDASVSDRHVQLVALANVDGDHAAQSQFAQVSAPIIEAQNETLLTLIRQCRDLLAAITSG